MNSYKISLTSHRNLTALWHMYGRKKENNVKLKLFIKQSVCQVLLLSLFLPGGVSDVNSSRLSRYPAFVSIRSLFGVFQYSIYRYRHSSLSSYGNERPYNWHLSSIVELQANNRCFSGGEHRYFRKTQIWMISSGDWPSYWTCKYFLSTPPSFSNSRGKIHVF